MVGTTIIFIMEMALKKCLVDECLIGYQFSGLNDEMVPMTNWPNAGNYSGTDDQTKVAFTMKNRLDSWLANHPNYYLDYRPQSIRKINTPRQIELRMWKH